LLISFAFLSGIFVVSAVGADRARVERAISELTVALDSSGTIASEAQLRRTVEMRLARLRVSEATLTAADGRVVFSFDGGRDGGATKEDLFRPTVVDDWLLPHASRHLTGGPYAGGKLTVTPEPMESATLLFALSIGLISSVAGGFTVLQIWRGRHASGADTPDLQPTNHERDYPTASLETGKIDLAVMHLLQSASDLPTRERPATAAKREIVLRRARAVAEEVAQLKALA